MRARARTGWLVVGGWLVTSVPLAPSPYIGSCARTGLAQDRYASFFFFLLWYARRLQAYQSKKKKKEAYRPCRRLLAYQSKKKKKEAYRPCRNATKTGQVVDGAPLNYPPFRPMHGALER